MTKEEVLIELAAIKVDFESQRAWHEANLRRIDQLILSIQKTPTGKPAPTMPRDDEGYAVEPETSVDIPRDPLAHSMADLVTPKQLGMIRALANEAGVDFDDECQQVMRVRVEELSKRAASSFIDHLKGLGGDSKTVPNCNCGQPAKLVSGTSARGPWQGYFCQKRKDDPGNCGFKQWLNAA